MLYLGQFMKLSEYKPYNDSDIHFDVIGNKEQYSSQEMVNYNNKYLDRLNNSCEKYFSDPKGTGRSLKSYNEAIKELLEASGINNWGRVLEFGAGTCKSSAVLSRNETVQEIHALDFSEILLREIAPRVISHHNGELSKIKFFQGDMNKIDQLPFKYDNAICYGAIHHLALPENFFAKLSGILNDGGSLFCIQEPALDNRFIHAKKTKAWIEKMKRIRIEGDNENIYTLKEYRTMCSHAFDFELISLRGIGPRWAWVKKDESTISSFKSLFAYRLRMKAAKDFFSNFSFCPLSVSYLLKKKT